MVTDTFDDDIRGLDGFRPLFTPSPYLAVQVVSNAVTLTTFRELRHHSWRMFRPVAVLAVRNYFVLLLMAECARKRLVLCLARSQQVECLLVTGSAVLRWYVRGIRYHLGHVGFVAFLAISGYHSGRVRLVALQAFRSLAVCAVAERAVKRGMTAFVFLELFDLRGMTGQAWFREVVGEGNLERCMRIRMAVQTVLEFIVRFSHVTLVAFRDVIFYRRPMAGVAVDARDILVRASVGSYICRLNSVALNAIAVRQHGV